MATRRRHPRGRARHRGRRSTRSCSKIDSRRIGDGSRIVLLHVNDDRLRRGARRHGARSQKGSFKIAGLSIGPLDARRTDDQPPVRSSSGSRRRRRARTSATSWSSPTSRGSPTTKGNTLPARRPAQPDDHVRARRPTATATSYDDDPDGHRCCCRPHEDAEAEWSDELAAAARSRRAQPAGLAAGASTRTRSRSRPAGCRRRRPYAEPSRAGARRPDDRRPGVTR